MKGLNFSTNAGIGFFSRNKTSLSGKATEETLEDLDVAVVELKIVGERESTEFED